MKKVLFFYLSFMTFIFYGFAFEVDKPEINTVKDKVIEFINYTGKHDNVDSAATIKNIGVLLGAAVKQDRAGDVNKYAVIHCIDSQTKDGLDADIFIIGKNAGVDHINNIRLIISGYLSSAYGYSEKDALTIAHFVTIYNALYRGNIKYFTEKYKSIVLKNLTPEKAGIALSYDQWAGQTQIVIPLTDPKYSGTISTVDTTPISDNKVIDKMRESDGKDIDVRKDMVDLKERESSEAETRADQAKKESDKQQKEADKKQKDADKAKDKADKQQKEADKKQKDADKAKDKADKTGTQKDKAEAEKKQKDADKAKIDADKAKTDAEKKQEEADAAQDEADKKTEEAIEEQNMADKKTEEAQEDRKDIAADTQKIIEEKRAEKKAESEAIIDSAIPGYGLKVVDEAKMLSRLVLLDLKTESELKISSIASIRGRNIYSVGKNLLAIAGDNSGNEVIALVLINARSLEIIKQSDENIAADSVLVKDQNNYYAVIDKNGKYFIGRYNENLEIQAQSAIEVLPYTPITISENGLLIQDIKGIIRLLSLKDLTNIVVSEKAESVDSASKENL